MRSGDSRRAKDRVKGSPFVPLPTQRIRELKPGYSDLRRAHLAALVRQIPKGHRLLSLASVAAVSFQWFGNRRRDPDGVRAASKLILDALVSARVLSDDRAAIIAGPFSDEFVDGPPGVVVRLHPSDGTMPVSVAFDGRLPDANEMIEAARLEGARREREQARIRWRR